MKIFNLILACLLLILVLLPYDTGRDNCQTFSGTVKTIILGENKDISFGIAEDENCYFINRGLEKHLDSVDLNSFIGQKISGMYAKHWSQNFGYKGRHVTQLRSGSGIIYSDFSE